MTRIGLIAAAMAATVFPTLAAEPPFAIPGTGQSRCYDQRGVIACPARPGDPFWGQDAQNRAPRPAYRDNGDGTVTDPVTGLMWEKAFRRTTFAAAEAEAAAARTGGYSDWRVPTIKELYSLIHFDGATGTAPPEQTGAPADARPYLDSRVFAFEYPTQGRFIDAQYVSRTAYVGTVMGGAKAFFGVNFADGRIKGYPQDGGPGRRSWYARLVRGNPAYGVNDLHDNGDGTVTDRASGLMWSKGDSGDAAFRDRVAGTARRDGRLDWREALAFCSGLSLAGHSDWRLPDAKQLQSIVDYARSPDTTDSPALSPVFAATAIRDDQGRRDWPYYWSSTTHLDGRVPGDFAVYVAFGRAQGWMGARGGAMGGGSGMGPGARPGMGPGMEGGRGGFGPPPGAPGFGPPPGGAGFGPPPGGGMGMGRGDDGRGEMRLLDVHGAGAQRSSPKSGDESRLPRGAGPQGDVLRIYNYARCVRAAS